MNLELYPSIPKGQKAKKIYVRGIGEHDASELRSRGYDPIDLMTMPRGTQDEEILYLYAKLQAYEEQTVPFSEDDRKVLELSLKAYGCLNPKSTKLSITAQLDEKSMDKLLNWGESRHTLRGNSTVQAAQFVIEGEKDGQ